MKPVPPCKDCKKRTPDCHAKCPLYIKYQDENLQYNRKIAHERFVDSVLKCIKRD